MKTIEDLKVEKTAFRREKDESGNTIRVPYTKLVARTPEVVKPGIRFLYYLVDAVLIRIIVYFFSIVLGLVIARAIVNGSSNSLAMLQFIAFLIALAINFLYYTFCESAFGGTPAKLMFGYTVIDLYGNNVSFGKAALRAVCRYVPFEAFSCFGERGWHDRWSKTYVVKRTEKQELLKLLGRLNDHTDILD